MEGFLARDGFESKLSPQDRKAKSERIVEKRSVDEDKEKKIAGFVCLTN